MSWMSAVDGEGKEPCHGWMSAVSLLKVSLLEELL